MKTKIALKFSLIISVAALLMTGCAEGNKFDYNKNAILFAGTEMSPVVKFPVDQAPASYKLSAIATKKVGEDIGLEYNYDPEALEAYNTTNGTNYILPPAGSVTISVGEEVPQPIEDGVQTVIKQGTAATETPATLTIVSTTSMTEGLTYVIPMTMKMTQGSIEILDASKTVFVRISRVVNFVALNMNRSTSATASVYSNFIFDDAKKQTLGAFTYEFKCLINAWNPNATNRISRLIQFTSKDESRSSMIRFSENGYPMSSVQWVCPAGSIVPANTFDFGRWYHFSLVYTGSTFILYIDGAKAGELAWPAANRAAIDFQRMELGMSWGSYRTKQAFNGRLADVRVWTKALTVGQIRAGICGVDPASDGLLAWWRFNEASGAIFRDATTHGYDMDWSKTQREATEYAGLTPFDASAYVERLSDALNKCSN